jgi:hypothetical protein
MWARIFFASWTALAEHAGQRLAEALQQAIARRVTAGIVDILELIEVH